MGENQNKGSWEKGKEKMEVKSRSWTSESLQLDEMKFSTGYTDIISSYFYF